jgi:hypothetical protein
MKQNFTNIIHYFIVKNLPFEILPNQVFYLENEYNLFYNDYLERNYDDIKQALSLRISSRNNRFSQFVYLPKLNKKRELSSTGDKIFIQYFIPQLDGFSTESLLEKFEILTTSNFSQYILKSIGFLENIKPGFLRVLKQKTTIDSPNFYVFQYVEFPDDYSIKMEDFVNGYFENWNNNPKIFIASTIFDFAREETLIKEHFPKQQQKEVISMELDIRKTSDILFDIDSHNIDKNVKELIEHIQTKGYNSSLTKIVIKSILDSTNESYKSDLFVEEKLSRIVIDRNHRIFLPDFNNLEISMTPLPKAIFLLFLRHPEGILFKHLIDYKQELSKIYRQISYRETQEEIDKSIAEIVNPLKNSINEKCSRIKEAFVKHFDDSIAKNYYITGERGKEKLIKINRSLVEYTQKNYLSS